jgi:hypothetical protein
LAGIDKTYCNSYSDYKEFKTWADEQTLTFFNGHKVCIGDWVWDYLEDDFGDGDRCIMNTPTWLDIYLIQNCETKFVLERMRYVYSEKSYKEFQSVDLTSKPQTEFQQNRKITIKKTDRTKFPLHTRPYKKNCKWWIQSDNRFSYDDETKVWSSSDSYYPHNTNTAHIKSIKGVVRHLRKQYLPKGINFTISGRYVGEDYLITIS